MPTGDVVVISLFNPAYPPLARQARIYGDVELKVGVRKDGSIQSAVAVSGHPMLTQAALNSAQQSRYECRKCNDEVTFYSLTYFIPACYGVEPGFPVPGRKRYTRHPRHPISEPRERGGRTAADLSLLFRFPGSFPQMPLSLGMRLPLGRGRLLLLPGSFRKVPEPVELRPSPPRTIRYLQSAAPQSFLLIPITLILLTSLYAKRVQRASRLVFCY
jgi:TonB family protein